MDNKTYYVVTIQRRDGHMIDGCFMASDWKDVKRFIRDVYPLRVQAFQFASPYVAARFAGRYFKLFRLIDPLNYRNDSLEC